MANRHLSRSIVLQSLFEWDFNDSRGGEGSANSILERNAEEFAPGMGDQSFMVELIGNVISKKKTIDEIIEKAAPEWPINRISIIDRNVLRIGLVELLFGDRGEVPPKVAINEAIELAKTFGGENSGKFVNGVLGAVYKEMGEPGKNETSKKKDKNAGIDRSKLPVEKLGGAVVYARKDGQLYLALVHDIFGHWTLSKGHIEEGEKEDEATKREIKEELGIEVEIKDKIGENEYIASRQIDGAPAGEKEKYRKHVSYFLAEGNLGKLKLEEGKGGLDDCRWFKVQDIVDLNIYDDILPIVTKAIDILVKR